MFVMNNLFVFKCPETFGGSPRTVCDVGKGLYDVTVLLFLSGLVMHFLQTLLSRDRRKTLPTAL